MEADMANFVVYETDERMFFLKKLLTGLRPLVETHIFAPNLVLSAERLKDVGDGETLVCGRLDEGAEKLAECKNLRVCRILENEKFQAVNARLTAEGALALILDHSMLSLDDMRVLVLGFGRTGAAVVRLMDKLGVSVNIATTASPRPAGAFAGEIVLPGTRTSRFTTLSSTPCRNASSTTNGRFRSATTRCISTLQASPGSTSPCCKGWGWTPRYTRRSPPNARRRALRQPCATTSWR